MMRKPRGSGFAPEPLSLRCSRAQSEKPQPSPLLPQRPAHSRASSAPRHLPLPARLHTRAFNLSLRLDWIENLGQAV